MYVFKKIKSIQCRDIYLWQVLVRVRKWICAILGWICNNFSLSCACSSGDKTTLTWEFFLPDIIFRFLFKKNKEEEDKKEPYHLLSPAAVWLTHFDSCWSCWIGCVKYFLMVPKLERDIFCTLEKSRVRKIDLRSFLTGEKNSVMNGLRKAHFPHGP